MGHAGRELADGGHLLGLDKLLTGVLQAAVEFGEFSVALEQFLLGLLPARNVLLEAGLGAAVAARCGEPPWLPGRHACAEFHFGGLALGDVLQVSMAPMTSPRALRSGAAVK
jgi:hypothetical protein